MKNKQGKIDRLIVFVIVAVAVIAVFLLLSGQAKISMEELGEATDISEGGEQERGLRLLLKNIDGEYVEIPEWFSTASTAPIFTIVTRPPALACTPATVAVDCPGYTVANEIDCWANKCVLKNIAELAIGAAVENPSTSEVTFQGVYVSSVFGPTEFTFPVVNQDLAPGDPEYLFTSDWMDITTWTGQKSFKVEVTGTNQYTGATQTAPSGTLILDFEADPTGDFIVSIISPI